MFSRLLRQIEVFRPQQGRIALPTNRLSTRLRGILYSSRYAVWVGVCICVSFCFMLANHGSDHGDALPDDHSTFEHVMAIQNQVFAVELFAEVALAFVALGPVAFFSKGWFAFDALVACGMAAGLLGQYYPFADKVSPKPQPLKYYPFADEVPPFGHNPSNPCIQYRRQQCSMAASLQLCCIAASIRASCRGRRSMRTHLAASARSSALRWF